MTGYYNKPEATAEAIKDGWFHTGDIGSIDADGYLAITDRKKDLLVTSGGKKIAPQPIENILKQSPLVAEAVVLGDRRKFAAALIVPDFAALERRLRDLGRAPAGSGDRAEEQLVSAPDVMALYQEIVDALNRELSQFERIKRVAILPREFTIASGELTPSLKVRRKVVEERWRAEIERSTVNEQSNCQRSELRSRIHWALEVERWELCRRQIVIGGGSMWMMASAICGNASISRSLTTCESRCAS